MTRPALDILDEMDRLLKCEACKSECLIDNLGCDACGDTGYFNRAPISELRQSIKAMEKLIPQNKGRES